MRGCHASAGARASWRRAGAAARTPPARSRCCRSSGSARTQCRRAPWPRASPWPPCVRPVAAAPQAAAAR
eukprot:3129224-Prymnesium_polylepis.1